MNDKLDQIKAFDGFINSFENEQRLYSAIKISDIETVNEILFISPHIAYRSTINYFPLHYAADYGNLEIVRLLLDSHFPIDECDEDGDTCLHYAVMHRNLELVKLLVRRHADMDVKNVMGETPVLIALKDNNIEIFRYLVARGANVCLRSKILINKDQDAQE